MTPAQPLTSRLPLSSLRRLASPGEVSAATPARAEDEAAAAAMARGSAPAILRPGAR
ncbi:MAG: hypothetical protein R3B48_05160 [Kofleriaceae bacterium]